MIKKIPIGKMMEKTADIARAFKKMRGKNMLSFSFRNFNNRLVLKLYSGDFEMDFKLVQVVCKNVLYSRNPIFIFPDPNNEKSTISADIDLGKSDYIAVHLYESGTVERGQPGYINTMTVENITFKNIQEWADEIKKYIEGEVRKYDVFIAYLKVHEQLTKG